MSDSIKVKSHLPYILLISAGGAGSIIAGSYLLFINPLGIDGSGGPNWIPGLFFLPFGLWVLFSILDFLSVEVREDSIEIKSLFRRRVILKEEIEGYGIEDYEGKHFSGERIRIITATQNVKFHSTQLESLLEIKEFLKGKKVIPGAFLREKIANTAAWVLAFVFILSPIFFSRQDEASFVAVGIPAEMNSELILLSDEGDEITFRIKDYENYTFVVSKQKALPNLKNFTGKVLVLIDNQAYAPELSATPEGGQTISPTPKIVPVTEISELK
ncbi:MAG: hypothetical protein HUU01_05515 [Saprospiraceae bacterium]|nr:hypothetical protein [Saprospiraceae bacterium]